MKYILMCLALLLAGLTLGGCSAFDFIAKPGIRSEFDKNVKDYNRMLRWQEMETAGILYMNPSALDEFMTDVEAIKKREVSITDYRIITTDYNIEKEAAEVRVEFDYYVLPSNRIKKLIYKQEWVYSEFNGSLKSWKLKSRLPAFE
jgi:hypothetical protein